MTNLTEVTNDQLQALKDFANAESKQLVEELEEILDDVAKTGQYIYPWHFMKPLYACKLDQVTSQFLTASPPLNNDGTEDEQELNNLKEFRDKLLQMFDKFVCAPFTIQRVSEMLTEPRKHYKSTAKFFRGLEKNILVVSTIDPVPSDLRPVLKRSLYDENPIEKQNGYVDTALKPQLKKIHLEENPVEEVKITEEEVEEKNTEEEVLSEDKSNEETIVTNSTEGLESMLVCNESVNPTNGEAEKDKTPEEEDETINNVDKKDDIAIEGEDNDNSKTIDES